MDSRELTEEQREALINRPVPTFGYLTKLGRRTDRRGFAQDEFPGGHSLLTLDFSSELDLHEIKEAIDRAKGHDNTPSA